LVHIAYALPSRQPISSAARIGHVHLKVADLDRSLRFYCDVLGFSLMQKMGSQPPSFQPEATTTTSD